MLFLLRTAVARVMADAHLIVILRHYDCKVTDNFNYPRSVMRRHLESE